MAHPTLLTYNLKSGNAVRLSEICKTLNIRIREVTPGEYALPIGALAGIPIAKANTGSSGEGFEDEMLVICHMLSNQLDVFLKALRSGGMPAIPLKAVLTPSNVAWDSVTLHRELMREHEAVRRQAR